MKTSSVAVRAFFNIVGILAVGLLVFSFGVLLFYQPLMTNFLPLSELQVTFLTGVGLGQLFLLFYFLASLVRFIKFQKFADRVKFTSIVLVICTVLCLVGAFMNFALLSDIYKQYQAELSQPEWALIFPLLGFQLLIASIFFVLHLSRRLEVHQVAEITRDFHLYLIVQVVGLICGFLGLAYTSLGFTFSQGWTLLVHTVIGSLAIIFPYGFVLILWGAFKLIDEQRAFLDEKQALDMGKSALVTLFVCTAVMVTLFSASYQNLGGVIRFLWMPFYLFTVLTTFSAGNLFFNSRG